MSNIDNHNLIEPNITKAFEIRHKVGKGAYGVVWKVINKQTDAVLVLKKNFDCYRASIDSQRVYREVIYLKALKHHDNIVRLYDVYSAQNKRDLYLTFEYMPTDLHVVIRSDMLNEMQMKYIIYQILRALKYIHSARILHRDIKPSNILIDQHCHVKLCDFGLCRSMVEHDMNMEEGRHMTDYVATRWYRPPEVLLCSNYVTDGIDIWAVACILGEMLRNIPLLPGNSTMNQVEKIIEISELHEVRRVASKLSQSNPIAEIMLDAVKVHRRITLMDLIGSTSAEQRFGHEEDEEDVYDFLKNLLAFDPKDRYSADIALSHSYLSDFHNPVYEPSFEGRPITSRNKNMLDDNVQFSVDRYRSALEARSKSLLSY